MSLIKLLLPEDIDEGLSIEGRIRNQIQELMKRREDMLLRQFKMKLKRLNYTFASDNAFELFCAARITRLSYPGGEELWLDYRDPKEPGTLILRFSTDVEFAFDSTRVIMTVKQ